VVDTILSTKHATRNKSEAFTMKDKGKIYYEMKKAKLKSLKSWHCLFLTAPSHHRHPWLEKYKYKLLLGYTFTVVDDVCSINKM
jgi:hypothetical protein